MNKILKKLMRLEGRWLKSSFDKLSENPQLAQKKFLVEILRRNKDTDYGRRFDFANIKSERDYQKRVPLNNYEDLRTDIEKIAAGQENILTADMPIMFNLTSGTGGEPKLIPVTGGMIKRTTRLMRQWLYRCWLDHPSFLDQFNLTVTSSAVEEHTGSGIPCGAMSGMIYENLPGHIMRSYVLPFLVSRIKNYDLRYYIIARLMLEKDVSFAATPNPSTLIKIAETGMKYQEEIIRSIQDGCLFSSLNFEVNKNEVETVRLLNASLRPNSLRAGFLSKVVEKNGRLLPCLCWPSFKLVGCWLGGSVGFHAEKLSNYYGDIPTRDIGYLASEGCFSLPYEDATSGGILALQNNFYEFIPQDSSSGNRNVKLSHELKTGEYYKVLLTNDSGLYRYDINDTVKVEKFYNMTPVVSFVRKTDDVLNITGEKLHVNQVIMAFQRIESKFNLTFDRFRIVSNQQQMRYDILLSNGNISAEFLKNPILPELDVVLSELNMEYLQKRKSGRLNPPRLYIMAPAWQENVKKEKIKSGTNDIQYKWLYLSPDFLVSDRKFINYIIDCEEG